MTEKMKQAQKEDIGPEGAELPDEESDEQLEDDALEQVAAGSTVSKFSKKFGPLF